MGVAAGANVIEPFRHVALEDTAVAAPGCLLVCVRERAARARSLADAYPPVQGCPALLDADGWERARAALRRWPLQWTLVTLRQRGARDTEIVIEAGGWGTAPLYLVARGEELAGDWDAARLYGRLPAGRPLVTAAAVRFIEDLDVAYGPQTMFAGLHLLTERSVARWGNSRSGRPELTFDLPPGLRCRRPRRVRDGADVLAAFWQITTDAIARWGAVADDASAGVELSGGLDSAIVAAATATITTGPLASYGLALVGPSRADQRRRRAELVRRFGLRDVELDLAGLVPLAARSRGVAGRPIVPWEEIYYEAADAMLAHAAGQGTRTLLTGFAGDELCEVAASEVCDDRRPPPDGK